MKTIGKFIASAALLFLFAVPGQAQKNKPGTSNQEQKKDQTASSFARGNYVDNDNNGVCDNFESNSLKGKGPNFVDKNGDGICDHRHDAGKGKANNCNYGKGNQHRYGNGCCGRGPGYGRSQNTQPKSN